jgi:Uma2 family endonuclease
MAHLVTEDDTPVDNRHSERQRRLLPDILFMSWPEGKPFEALTDVGLFTSLTNPPLVPDFMLSLGVQPRGLSSKKADKSYMTWIYGKPPDLVVEIVSNREGGELDRKLEKYAQAGVAYYVVYDPFGWLGERELRTFRLSGRGYTEIISAHWLPDLGLGLTLWDGEYDDVHDRWLRFVDADGRLLPTRQECVVLAGRAASQADQRAEDANLRAEQATERAEQATERAERLAARLRELGLDPDEI